MKRRVVSGMLDGMLVLPLMRVLPVGMLLMGMLRLMRMLLILRRMAMARRAVARMFWFVVVVTCHALRDAFRPA
jgi:hypothetical protein